MLLRNYAQYKEFKKEEVHSLPIENTLLEVNHH